MPEIRGIREDPRLVNRAAEDQNMMERILARWSVALAIAAFIESGSLIAQMTDFSGRCKCNGECYLKISRPPR